MRTLNSKNRLTWRSMPVLLAGLLAGAVLVQPAVAHVTRSLRHLTKHLDPRYYNVGEKVGDANTLDGLDSTAFLRSTGKAADADRLDGFDSNGLVRLAEAKATNLATTNPLLTTTISAPSNGFLLMEATIDIFGTASNFYECHLDLNGADLAESSRVSGGTAEADCATNSVRSVATGTHTVSFEASSFPAGTNWNERQLSVLFVPFGGTGTQPRTMRDAEVDGYDPVNTP